MIELTLPAFAIALALLALAWTYRRISDWLFFRKIERLIAAEQERQKREKETTP